MLHPFCWAPHKMIFFQVSLDVESSQVYFLSSDDTEKVPQHAEIFNSKFQIVVRRNKGMIALRFSEGYILP